MRPFAVAGIQMNVVEGGDNLAVMEHDLEHLVKRFPWIQMVLLSELALSGRNPRHAQPLPGTLEPRFSALARRHGIWRIPGTVYETCGDKVFNTASVF